MSNILTSILIKATASGLLLLSTVTAAADGVMVVQESAWARATPPGSTTTAIYLTLMNHGSANVDLTSVTADISDKVELHTHINTDGTMKMQQVSAITIPTGGEASLKPHGDHIMVFNLQEPLVAGKEVKVELSFNDGNKKTLTIPVHKESPMAGEDTMQHDEQHEPMKKNHTDDAHQHDKAS